MSARSADARRRLAGALLAALSVWPLVQIALAFGLDTSPELFGAWGSYAVPSRVPYLSIEATRGLQSTWLNWSKRCRH